MEPIRRRQIIAATKECIHREGITRTSANRIAKVAGIAPTLILHYFDDKEALLLETFRSIYREFTSEIRRRLAVARTPQERLLALLEAQISPETLTPSAVNTWLAIYSTMRDFPLLQRIERAYDTRFISNLSHALRAMGVNVAEVRDIAEELSVFIDGLWLNTANPVTFTPEKARGLLYRYLNLRLPGYGFAPSRDETARRAAEDAALSPEARQFLKDNLPIVPIRLSRATVQAVREDFSQLFRPDARAAAKAHGVRLSRVQMGGIDTLRITPKVHDAPAPRLFYLFGGGYFSGEPQADLPISGALAVALRCVVASPRYRLAPEHPYPAALEDALAAYRAFAATAPRPFWAAGESAGGGLLLALMHRARHEGLPLPDRMALLSPWVDLTHSLPAANDGFDPTFARRSLLEAARLYAGPDADLADPGISPLFGDLGGLPPAVITTGSRDILREQALALSDAIRKAGGQVALHDWPGLWHVFEFYRALPEAAQSLDRIAAFLRDVAPTETEISP